jgi:hypothetical protein
MTELETKMKQIEAQMEEIAKEKASLALMKEEKTSQPLPMKSTPPQSQSINTPAPVSSIPLA